MYTGDYKSDDERIKEASRLNMRERLGVSQKSNSGNPLERIEYDESTPSTDFTESIDPSHHSTLGALGYTTADILLGKNPSKQPLTVQELEDRKAETGEGIDINAGIMRRYTPDERGNTAAGALYDYNKADTDLTVAGSRVKRQMDAYKPLLAEPATAPENRANHPGRVHNDPWASDPAGPNEAMNATEAREMFEDNADSIARENDNVSTEEH